MGPVFITLMEYCAGFKLTAVTYHCGFMESFQSVLPDDVRRDLITKGVQVVFATHALSGVERGQ